MKPHPHTSHSIVTESFTKLVPNDEEHWKWKPQELELQRTENDGMVLIASPWQPRLTQTRPQAFPDIFSPPRFTFSSEC